MLLVNIWAYLKILNAENIGGGSRGVDREERDKASVSASLVLCAVPKLLPKHERWGC